MKLVRRIDLGNKEILVWEEPTYWAQLDYKTGRQIDSGEMRQWSVWAALQSLCTKIRERRDNQKHPWHRKDFDKMGQQIADVMDKEVDK